MKSTCFQTSFTPIRASRSDARAWCPEEDNFLGLSTDAAVARLLKRQLTAVRARRRQLGIPSSSTCRREWTLTELWLLGTAPDRDIALRLGRTLASVQTRRDRAGIPGFLTRGRAWTAAESRLLGTAADATPYLHRRGFAGEPAAA